MLEFIKLSFLCYAVVKYQVLIFGYNLCIMRKLSFYGAEAFSNWVERVRLSWRTCTAVVGVNGTGRCGGVRPHRSAQVEAERCAFCFRGPFSDPAHMEKFINVTAVFICRVACVCFSPSDFRKKGKGDETNLPVFLNYMKMITFSLFFPLFQTFLFLRKFFIPRWTSSQVTN